MSNIMKPPIPEPSAPPVPDAAQAKRAHQYTWMSNRWAWMIIGLLAMVVVTILAAFGRAQWQILGFGMLLLSVVVVVLLALVALLITLGIAAITRRRTRILPWLGLRLRLSIVLVTLTVAVAGAVIGSQWHTSTPPILGADGKILPGSIATLEQVTLGGSQQ